MSKTNVNFNEFMSLAGAKPVGKRACDFKGGRALDVTEKQKASLHKCGIGYSGMMFRGQGCDVLDEAYRRIREGLASPKQMRTLSRMGITEVNKRTFKEASFILSGGNPDDYKGLTFIIAYKEGEEWIQQSATSRREARVLFQQIREGHDKVAFKMIEE